MGCVILSFLGHIQLQSHTKYGRASVRNQAASVLSRRSFVVVRDGRHLMQGELEKRKRKKKSPCPFPIRAGTHGSVSQPFSVCLPHPLSPLQCLAFWVHTRPRSLSGFSMPTTSSYTNLPLRSRSFSGTMGRPTRPSPLPHTL